MENVGAQAVASSDRSLSYGCFARLNGSPLTPSPKAAGDPFAMLGWCRAVCTRGAAGGVEDDNILALRIGAEPQALPFPSAW